MMMNLTRRLTAKPFTIALVKPCQLIPKFLSTSVGGTDKTNSAPEKPSEVLVYTAKYCNKMKWLRRVSLGSSFLSIIFLVSLLLQNSQFSEQMLFHNFQPLSLTLDSGLMPILGQAVIASTVLCTSMGSTGFLALVGHPYVGTLHELYPQAEVNGKPERRFKASKFNLFGNKKYSEFTLKDIQKNPKNPFASFQVEKKGEFVCLFLTF